MSTTCACSTRKARDVQFKAFLEELYGGDNEDSQDKVRLRNLHWRRRLWDGVYGEVDGPEGLFRSESRKQTHSER